MNGHSSGCIICGAPLIYFDTQRILECQVCHEQVLSNASCEKGHFICDKCHVADSISLVLHSCLESDSDSPVDILVRLMNLPGIHMHGPEHHIMVGAALLTAYRNAGGPIDLPKALEEMRLRGEQVPGGICGMWGTCGAAVSCGIAYSLINGTSPLSKNTWALGNKLTSECLSAISEYGGPRCCKRDGFTALIAAVKFIRKHNGVKISLPKKIGCSFSNMNRQCLGNKCPYHQK